MATSQDFVNWVCSPAIDHRFLKYVLLAERDAFPRFASGTTHQTIYFPEAKAFHVCLPAIGEQRAIADVLSALDNKIELNRRMNETLEAMAQALFKSWFVDFEPVRSNAEGRDAALPAPIHSLFPGSFQDSELGQIPEGWRHVRVSEFCEGLYDGPHATPPEAGSGPIFLGIKNFKPTSLDLSEVRHISTEDYPRWTKRVIPEADDIVFTYEATLGYFALVPPALCCCLGRRTALVVSLGVV